MIVIGLGFGDEGKGLTTSFLCSQTQNPLVVRFNGGHQAGHTVVYNGERHVFSNFGSGTLQGAPTFWSQFCTLYPVSFINELETLTAKPEIFVHPLCPITTPYDVHSNQNDAHQTRNGTVGVGFGKTIQRQESYYKLFAMDLFHENVLHEKLRNINKYYGFGLHNDVFQGKFEYFLECIDKVKKIIKIQDNSLLLSRKYNTIFEGAQGVLLDQDFGFFPNVTRSNTTTKNVFSIKQKMGVSGVFYVTRTYQARHGAGFMTNENDKPVLKNNEKETNINSPYQGEFRIGKLDESLLNYSLECDNIFSSGLRKNLVITCMDQLEIDHNELLSKLNTKFDGLYISYGDSFDKMKKVF